MEFDKKSDEQEAVEASNPTGGISKFIKEAVICILQVAVLTLVIINFIGRVSIVQGSSMVPSLYTDNRILVNMLAYRLEKPKRGDIVIFQCPTNKNRDYIKRVIGLPGEELEIKDGLVLINGRAISEPYLDNIDKSDEIENFAIPEHHIFVMGDNRINSEDSRVWGPVDYNLLKGKAQMIFWPPESFKVLK